MTPESGNSTEIGHWLGQLRNGDVGARQQLIRAAQDRLTRLARRMLSDFPGVHRWEDTDDVFQNGIMRLCRTLERVVPDSTTAFVSLAARDIRCTLIDLARHYFGPLGPGRHHLSGSHADSRSRLGSVEAEGESHEPLSVVYWSEFHQKVDQLPFELLQTMDLLWYQGLSQGAAAELLNISERTVQRRWRQACLELHDSLGGLLPGPMNGSN